MAYRLAISSVRQPPYNTTNGGNAAKRVNLLVGPQDGPSFGLIGPILLSLLPVLLLAALAVFVTRQVVQAHGRS